MAYTMTKIQKDGCIYYAIYNEDLMKYFAGYDFMGSVTWEKNLGDCSWLLDGEAYQIKSDLEAADEPAKRRGMNLIINGKTMGTCSAYHQGPGSWCFTMENRIEIRVPMDEIKWFTSSGVLEIITFRR